ncbi:hypothetical protein CCUS01_16110 [Colletotrichum cuscutae]|uniref:Uncharacterized protein n=1 Tax=Colletotrichum cuscutae TaxID=1209917 RepID=A0AAI9Y398_9PEZI|nr:hypothetical protein CCUS01_16110 [Colletotrichum cuscutae]
MRGKQQYGKPVEKLGKSRTNGGRAKCGKEASDGAGLFGDGLPRVEDQAKPAFAGEPWKKRSTCTRQMDPSKSPQDSSGHRMAHREVTELTGVDGASGAWWSPPTTPAHHPPSLGKVAASATRTSSCGAFLAAPRPCALSCQSVTALAALGPGHDRVRGSATR